MSLKFKDSMESVSSSLMLWQQRPTQISVENVYDLRVYPTTTILNEGAINFNIPQEPKGMLSDIEIVTKFKIKKGEADLGETDEISIINNFTNSLWQLLDVQIADRVDLTQSLRNAYGFATYFNYCLNFDENRSDYLFATQVFLMDSGKTKDESETVVFSGESIKNEAGAKRAKRIKGSKSVTVSAPLHCPLFTTEKCLPTNMKIRISLTRNSDKFLLLGDSDEYKVHLEDVHLRVTYFRPREVFLNLIEERLMKEAALYFVTKPDLIVRPISQSSRVIRLSNVFHGKLPKHCFFAIQKSADFDGTFTSSPYSMVPFKKFQLFLNGTPYFTEPLSIDYTEENGAKIYSENWSYLQQLYRTIGKEFRGTCLVNSSNFQLNHMVGVSLTSDRSPSIAPYLSCQSDGSSLIEIDFGYERNQEPLVLIIYSIFDRLIKITGDRNIEVID